MLVEIQDFDGSERLAAVLGADIAGEPEFKKRLIPNIAITPEKNDRPCLGSEFSVQILPKGTLLVEYFIQYEVSSVAFCSILTAGFLPFTTDESL